MAALCPVAAARTWFTDCMCCWVLLLAAAVCSLYLFDCLQVKLSILCCCQQFHTRSGTFAAAAYNCSAT